MSFLTLALDVPLTVEHMPQDPSVVSPGPLTVGWTGKQTHYLLPYDLADLAVRPGDPDPPVVNPPVGPAPAPDPTGGAAVPPPTSGVVRPPTAPRLAVQARVNPVLFRRSGIRVRITLPEDARVELYVTTRVRKHVNRRRATTVTRKITRTRTLPLRAGTTAVRLAASARGRSTVGARSRLTATVVARTRYADGRRVTTTRRVRIARNPAS